MKIAILALQGNVVEHQKALVQAAKNLGVEIEIVMARQVEDLDSLDGIVLPGGESTTISLLLERFDMFEKLKKIPFIMGTCAGLILMSKEVEGLEAGQKTLGLMDLRVCRNAYGRQMDSFASELDSVVGENDRNLDVAKMGKIMFIRAPKIKSVGEKVIVLAKVSGKDEIAIVEQEKDEQYLLAMTCHPEMTTTKIAEYFLSKIAD